VQLSVWQFYPDIARDRLDIIRKAHTFFSLSPAARSEVGADVAPGELRLCHRSPGREELD
jgi:hypothetical protein